MLFSNVGDRVFLFPRSCREPDIFSFILFYFPAVERFSTFDVRPEPGADSSLVKISNALMHIDNASLQSFARGGLASNGKTVGVGELREALGGESRLLFFFSPRLLSLALPSPLADRHLLPYVAASLQVAPLCQQPTSVALPPSQRQELNTSRPNPFVERLSSPPRIPRLPPSPKPPPPLGVGERSRAEKSRMCSGSLVSGRKGRSGRVQEEQVRRGRVDSPFLPCPVRARPQ